MSIIMSQYHSSENTVKEIKYTSASVTGADITKLILDNTLIWAKPFNLSLTIGTGITNVQIQRTVKSDPSAPTTITKTASSVVPVYYGETIKVTPTAATGYKLTGTWPTTLNIVDNAALTINATSSVTQLNAPVIVGGGCAYQEIERLFTIYASVSNTNSKGVTAVGKLYNLRGGGRTLVATTEKTAPTAAYEGNVSANIGFEDTNNRLGYRDWAVIDEDNYSQTMSNGALIAVYFKADGYRDSAYRFWSNKYDVTNVNKTGKIPTPTVAASYYAPADGNPYEVFLEVEYSQPHPFGSKIVVETPSGTVELDSYRKITVDSLNSVIKVRLVDSSGFGIADSDVVSFNLANAEQLSSSESTAS